MTTIETILARAMSDPAFAELLFANPAETLAAYNLSADEIEQFKGISRADFEAFTSASLEQRKSMSINFSKIEYSYVPFK
jgi:hypothetical protein